MKHASVDVVARLQAEFTMVELTVLVEALRMSEGQIGENEAVRHVRADLRELFTSTQNTLVRKGQT
jgi:hypothetical protein